jgi:succinyl-CoA synthetase beta subunit
MKLYEYQAKMVFNEHQIPTPKSLLIARDDTKSDVLSIGFPQVIKAQVLSGGRGKRGLIQLVKNEDEAAVQIKHLFSREPGMKHLLVEEAVHIDKEIYVSITFDAQSGKAMLIASASGGVEIETLAIEHPELILKEFIDLRYGLASHQARHMAYQMNLSVNQTKQMIQILMNLYDIFVKYDAELVEINPLFATKEDMLVAGDGKIMIDDNSLFRQPRFAQTETDYSSEAAYDASIEGIPFIQFDGDIGLMCAGAGLTTTVYDLIHYEGGTVANYLEFGGPNYKKAVKAMEICLKVPSKVILIVTFGTIARADVMAEGIVEAIHKLKPNRPIVTCIRGTNEARAVELLKEAGLTPMFDTEEAVRLAVRLAKGDTK